MLAVWALPWVTLPVRRIPWWCEKWYNYHMAANKVSSFMKRRRHLMWYTWRNAGVSVPAALEAVLNYGDVADVRAFIAQVGRERVRRTFRAQQGKPRSNYRPEVRALFRAIW